MGQVWSRRGTRWRRIGGASIDTWVPGAVKPDATNTGCSGALTAMSGNQTITAAGTVLEGLDITGRVIVQAANVTIRNCRIRGGTAPTGTTNWGLVSCYDAAVASLLVEDCTLIPDTVVVGWSGILGHDYTARRCRVRDAVDGFGVHNASAPSSPANVLIEGCYVSDLAYLAPDANHADNHTHNDCVQIQGNGGVTIRGNVLDCNAGPKSNTTSPMDPSCTGQAIGITPNVSYVPDVLIEGNWIDYGAQSITVIQGGVSNSGLTSATIRNNRFGRNQPLLTKDSVSARRAVYIDSDLTMPGLPASTGTDTAGNVYDDDGSPITVYRSSTAA